jgi:hypothetical protein
MKKENSSDLPSLAVSKTDRIFFGHPNPECARVALPVSVSSFLQSRDLEANLSHALVPFF